MCSSKSFLDSSSQFLKENNYPIMVFLLTRIALFFAVYSGILLFCGEMKTKLRPGLFENILLIPWARWDTTLYVDMIQNGYKNADLTAFLPFYPFLAKLVDIFIDNPPLSAIIVSNLSFLFALVFMYKLVILKTKDQQLAQRTVFYISIFPTTFFFISGLSESTFLLLSILTFYYAEKEKWRRAGFFGILTTLTRPIGFLITIPVLLIYLVKKNFNFRQIKVDVLPVLFIPIGLLIFAGVLAVYGKSFSDFFHSQHKWTRALSPPLWDIWRSIKILLTYNLQAALAGNYPIELMWSVIVTLIFLIGSTILLFRNFAYGIYSLMLILAPLTYPARNWHLFSIMRFVIVAFPVFILFAYYGKNKIVDLFIIVFSLLFLAIFAVYNGLGGWIS